VLKIWGASLRAACAEGMRSELMSDLCRRHGQKLVSTYYTTWHLLLAYLRAHYLLDVSSGLCASE
jgi:hypothetical protein